MRAGPPRPGCAPWPSAPTTRPCTAAWPKPTGGGNGIGVPAAPLVADLDGDGNLEIVLLTFDHGVDVYTVPGSGTQCLPWPTGRGNLLRNGQGPAYVR
jgi:hypothetical protein